jgi:hypothetical protein
MLERAGKLPGNSLISCRQTDENGDENIAYGQFLKPGGLTGPGRALTRMFKKIAGKRVIHAGENLIKPDWVSGSVIMIGRDFFGQLKGFDENFWMYFEDMDLCKRARDAGCEIYFFTDLTIEHKHGGSSRLNSKTTALTKTEVKISRHLYISKHFSDFEEVFSQVWLTIVNILSGIIEAALGLVLFFIPEAIVRVHIFFRLMRYYFSALGKGTWVSPRSVKNGNN